MILEYVPCSLADFVYGIRPWPQAPPLDPPSILSQLCSLAAWLHHQGTVCGDFSPSNVRMDPDNARWVVKVIDSGELAPGSANLRGLVGTPGFVAPEVLSGQPRSEMADMFSIGILAFILFTKYNMMADEDASSPDPVRQASWMRDRVLPSLVDVDEKFQLMLGGLLALKPENRWSAQKVNNYLWKLTDSPAPDSRKRIASPASLLHSSKRRRESCASTIRAPGTVASSLALDSLSSADSFATAEQGQDEPSESPLDNSTPRQSTPSFVAQPAMGRLSHHLGHLPFRLVSAAEGASQPTSSIDAVEWNKRFLQTTQGPTSLTNGTSEMYQSPHRANLVPQSMEQPHYHHEHSVPATVVSRTSSPGALSIPGAPFVDDDESDVEAACALSNVKRLCATDSVSEDEEWVFEASCLDDWYDGPEAEQTLLSKVERKDRYSPDQSEWPLTSIPNDCMNSMDDSEAETEIEVGRLPESSG